MSQRINKNTLSEHEINEIKNDCFVQGAENVYGPAETLRAYGETTNAIYIPFAYAKKRFKTSPNKDIEYPKAEYKFNTKDYPFRTDGGRDQEQVFNEASNLIKKYRSVLLSLYCSFGKTYTGIRLAQSTGLKTAILVHRGILFDQWIESIQKFSTGIVQKVGTDGILDPNADFYIFNIAFVHKKWDKSLQCWKAKKLGAYPEIGVLIVDEAHIACASEMSKALLYFNPRCCIALTATPKRKDGMDKALELYFGEYATTQIIRIASDPFLVYRLPTNIKPEYSYNAFGKKDWNSVIKSVIENKNRNDLIINLVKKFSENNILILTKRKDHCKILAEQLNELGITNTIMVGIQKVYDKTARVLLSTYSKLGVGFDDTRLNMLIVACSVTEIEQYAGRLRDGIGKKRIIIDLVDNDPNCLSHWQERRKWYLSRNGIIKHYNKCFPEEKENVSIEQEEQSQEINVEKPKRLARLLK